VSIRFDTGDNAFATKDAVRQGILPEKTLLHIVRRNSRHTELVRVTWKGTKGELRGAQVHESFLQKRP
jgi:hypothetical protein